MKNRYFNELNDSIVKNFELLENYDKLINKLVNIISEYNKKNKTFFDSISVKLRSDYYRFYKVNYLPSPVGNSNYYFTEISESKVGYYLNSNYMKNNIELRSLTKLLITTVRDRNKILKNISNFVRGINKSKPKINLIRNHLQKQLDI